MTCSVGPLLYSAASKFEKRIVSHRFYAGAGAVVTSSSRYFRPLSFRTVSPLQIVCVELALFVLYS